MSLDKLKNLRNEKIKMQIKIGWQKMEKKTLNLKKLNVLLFVFIFVFSNVSQAGPISRVRGAWNSWWHGTEKVADDVAKDGKRAAKGSTVNPNLVTQNADGITVVRLADVITKIKPDKNVLGIELVAAKVARVLMRRSKAAPVIVAEAGTGKTANVAGMQHMIDIKHPAVAPLHGKQLYFFNILALTGGTELRGSFEKRLAHILADMALPENANKILVVDELENVLKDKELGVKFLEAMKSYLTSDMQAKLIFNITPGPYETLMKDPQLIRRMIPIYVKPPTDAIVINILMNTARAAEEIDGVKISSHEVSQILTLSKKHPTLKNPDVALTIMNDAINNAIADRLSGSIEITELSHGLQGIQGEIQLISNMRREGIAQAYGPHYDLQLEDLFKRQSTISGVIESYESSRRITDELRSQMLAKIERRKQFYKQLDENKKNDSFGGEVDPQQEIDKLSAQIQSLGEQIQEKNNLLMAFEIKEEHIVDAAMVVLNRDRNFIRNNMIASQARTNTVNSIAEKTHGRFKNAITAIVRRELSQRRLNEDGGIPAFLIVSPSSTDSAMLVKAVSKEITGAEPYTINAASVNSHHALANHRGADAGTAASDKSEGLLIKDALKTGGSLGVLFSGIENAISELVDFANVILTDRFLLSNRGEKVGFERSTMFLTVSGMPSLTNAQTQYINGLDSESARQLYLKKQIKKYYRSRASQNQGEGLRPIDPNFLEKLYVIYLNEVLTDAQAKAVVAETLKSRALKKVLAENIEISLDFTDEAVDYLFAQLKRSGSNDVNRVLVNDVMGVIDDAMQPQHGNPQIIPGDHVVVSAENGRLKFSTVEWADKSRRADTISTLNLQNRSGSGRTDKSREALEKALKLVR